MESHNGRTKSGASHRYLTRLKLRRLHTSHSHFQEALCLPTEILFSILVYVETKTLREVVRYVCKQWYHIVNDPHFIRVHRQLHSTALLVQNLKDLLFAYYFEGDTTSTSTSALQRTKSQLPFPATIVGSCNGLILLHDSTNK